MAWMKILIQTLGIQLAAGRLFSKEFTNDTARGIILNEEAVAKIGFTNPQEAVGKSVYMGARAGRIIHWK
jgi:putative ABC transport system permease protein